MKTYFIVLSLLLSQTIFAQSFTLLPNSATSNALNTTANKVGINIGNPNYELHINRVGAVNTFMQFSNNTSGRSDTDGLLIGINSAGRGIITNQSPYGLSFGQKDRERFLIEHSPLTIASSKLTLNDAEFTQESNLTFSSIIRSSGGSSLKLYSDNSTSQENTLQFNVFPINETGDLVDLEKAGMVHIYAGTEIKNILFRSNRGGKYHFTNNNLIAMTINTATRTVGIGTDPTRALDVNGNARIGFNGTTITAINNFNKTIDLPSIAAGSSWVQTITIPNILKEGNTVVVSPNEALTNGIIIAYARVAANNTIEVTFSNISSTSIDIQPTSFNCTVITFPFIP